MSVTKRPAEVTLTPEKRLAKEYHHGNIFEQVTEPDMSASLAQMVQTGTVSVKSNARYYYPEDMTGDDEQDHEHPDIMKLGRLDPVERENLIENFVNDENNYEKQEEPRKEATTEGKAGGKKEEANKASDTGEAEQ